MGDWPVQLIDMWGAFGVFSTVGEHSVIAQATANMGLVWGTSAIWPTANTALFVPVVLAQQKTVFQLACFNGATLSGNLDLGIYDIKGNRLVSSGSTAQAGISVLQVIDTADVTLPAGVYYLAQAMDNITATTISSTAVATTVRLSGVAQMASAFPLPSTATFAAATSTKVPFIVGVIDSAVF